MGKIVSLVNQKGGSGKTTGVLEIAYQAGVQGLKVLVIDLDPQGDATRMLLGLKPGEECQATVFDLFLNKIDPLAVVCAASDKWPNILVLPSSGKLATIEGYLGNRSAKDQILRRILQPLKSAFDLLLIDLGPAADYLTLNALVASDLYQVPLDHSTYGIGGLETIKDLAKDVMESGANPGLRFAGAHISGHQKGGSHGVRLLEADIHAVLECDLVERVPDTTKVIEAQRRQQPVGSLDPQGKVAKSYRAICDHLVNF